MRIPVREKRMDAVKDSLQKYDKDVMIPWFIIGEVSSNAALRSISWVLIGASSGLHADGTLHESSNDM